MWHNILITSCGKRVALTISVKKTLTSFFPEGKVFTSDACPEYAPAGYFSDKCFQVPRVTSEDYIDTLLDICFKYKVGLIIPTIDTELAILARNKDVFAKHGIALIVSDILFINICRDKHNTAEFFTAHDINIPKSIDIQNPTFPIFAKPYDGSLSKDLYTLTSLDDITPEIINNPRLIFMEYIDKKIYDEYTVDIYFGRDNEIKCIIPRKRIEIRAGEINKGVTTKNILVPYLKERLHTISGCVGCICVQVFHNPQNNDIVGIEINPRFGGGYPLSFEAGGNFIEYLIREYMLSEKIEYSEHWTDNLLMLRYDDAVYVK